jgi:hypothetical protein
MTKVDNAKSLADFYSRYDAPIALSLIAMPPKANLTSIRRIFTSEPFTFLVGDSKSKIVVNGAAIAQLSPALDTLVNGSMKEAHAKTAEIPDITEEEFVRFCQFAYTGDYSPVQSKQASSDPGPSSEQGEPTPPASNRNGGLHDESKEDVDETWPASPVIKKYGKKGARTKAKPVEPAPPATPKVEPKTEKPLTLNGHHGINGVNGTSTQSIWDSLTPPSSPQSPQPSAYSPFGSKKDNLRSKFDRREYCTTTPKQLSLSACEPVPNSSPEEDYGPVLLGHARLYVLGDKYDIPSLRNLALYKLHKTLVVHTLYDERFVDVVDLAKFVYDNTNDKPDEALRSLVVEYVACEIEMIGKAQEFDQLMEQGGPFVRDLWKLTRTNLL